MKKRLLKYCSVCGLPATQTCSFCMKPFCRSHPPPLLRKPGLRFFGHHCQEKSRKQIPYILSRCTRCGAVIPRGSLPLWSYGESLICKSCYDKSDIKRRMTSRLHQVSKVTVDWKKCKGHGVCVDICPVLVFELQDLAEYRDTKKSVPVRADEFFLCMACQILVPPKP